MSRRVVVSAVMDGKDYETFGSDEFGHAEFTRETILNNDQPQNVMEMVMRWGGECRAELNIVGQQVDGGSVRLTGLFKFFEGTSENTNDLDGQTDFTFICPRGRTVNETRQVKNTDEGDDEGATVRLTVTNSIVED